MKIPNWVASTRFGKRFIDNLLALLILPVVFGVLGLICCLVGYLVFTVAQLPAWCSGTAMIVALLCVISISSPPHRYGMFVDYEERE